MKYIWKCRCFIFFYLPNVMKTNIWLVLPVRQMNNRMIDIRSCTEGNGSFESNQCDGTTCLYSGTVFSKNSLSEWFTRESDFDTFPQTNFILFSISTIKVGIRIRLRCVEESNNVCTIKNYILKFINLHNWRLFSKVIRIIDKTLLGWYYVFLVRVQRKK